MSFIGNVPAEAYSTVAKDTFSGNGSTTDFTLSLSATTNGVEVFVENVQQEPTTAYTISGTTLSFTAAPTSGTNNIYVIHRGPAVQQVVPPAGVAIDASTVTASGDVSIADKIIHTGDTNTAIRFPAADTVTVETGGSERVRVNSSGNVGIGTSSPNAKLMVSHGNNAPNSSGNMTNGSVFSNSGTLTALQVGSTSDYSYLNSAYSNNSGVGVDLRIYNGGGSESMRIGSNGSVGINNTDENAMLKISSDSGVSTVNAGMTNFIDAEDRIGHYRHNSNASLSTSMYLIYTARSNTDAFNFAVYGSNSASDNEFVLAGDGDAFADGAWNGGGADYAEYFEWADGNTSNEDRRGYTVVLDGNMIRKATDEDDASQIIGAVSATPCVIGDHAENKWSGKYLKDDFGNYIRDEHNVVEWTEQELVEEAQEAVFDEEGNVIQEAKEAVYKEKKHSYEDWNIPEGIVVPDDATVLTQDENGNPFTHRRLNPDFDPDAEYITRENRPEWSPIGMMGKLRIRTGQPVGDRWIKMRDISDSVEEWLVR